MVQSAIVSAGGTAVSGNLNSLPNSQFSLEFFSSSQCDGSGFGEGATFLGEVTVTTDGAGNAAFQGTVASAPVGSSVTATATHLATGNTSEFSACQLASGSSAPALALLSGVSRKAHGETGSFDVNLPLSGPPAVECRGSGGNHTLVFTFNNNVTSGSAEIDSGTATWLSTTFSANTVTVNLTNVANAQTVTLALSGVTDEFSQVLPETAISMKVLVGDVTGNGTVNSSDVSQAKAQAGQPSGTTLRADVNANGAINTTDIGMIKSLVGTVAN